MDTTHIICIGLNCIVAVSEIALIGSIPKRELMQWDELKKKYPHIKDDNLDFIVFSSALLLALGLMYYAQETDNDFYFSLVFLFIPIGYFVMGIKSLLTDIYGYGRPVGSFTSARFIYDQDQRFRWVAKSQIVISAFISLVIAYLVFA